MKTIHLTIATFFAATTLAKTEKFKFAAKYNGNLEVLSGEKDKEFNSFTFKIGNGLEGSDDFFSLKHGVAHTENAKGKSEPAGSHDGYFGFGHGVEKTSLKFDEHSKVTNRNFHACSVRSIPSDHRVIVMDPARVKESGSKCEPVDIYKVKPKTHKKSPRDLISEKREFDDELGIDDESELLQGVRSKNNTRPARTAPPAPHVTHKTHVTSTVTNCTDECAPARPWNNETHIRTVYKTYTNYVTYCPAGTTIFLTVCQPICNPTKITVVEATTLTITGTCIIPETIHEQVKPTPNGGRGPAPPAPQAKPTPNGNGQNPPAPPSKPAASPQRVPPASVSFTAGGVSNAIGSITILGFIALLI